MKWKTGTRGKIECSLETGTIGKIECSLETGTRGKIECSLETGTLQKIRLKTNPTFKLAFFFPQSIEIKFVNILLGGCKNIVDSNLCLY